VGEKEEVGVVSTVCDTQPVADVEETVAWRLSSRWLCGRRLWWRHSGGARHQRCIVASSVRLSDGRIEPRCPSSVDGATLTVGGVWEQENAMLAMVRWRFGRWAASEHTNSEGLSAEGVETMGTGRVRIRAACGGRYDAVGAGDDGEAWTQCHRTLCERERKRDLWRH
jgi:hypothetical protein